MKTSLFRSTLVTFVSFIAVIGVVSAWTAPTQTAPNGNVSAPINVGSTPQTKTGSFTTSGRLGTNGYNADSGYPTGWGGGVHTWDVYAEGTIAAGSSGNIASYINNSGVVHASGYMTVGSGLYMSGAGDIWQNGNLVFGGGTNTWIQHTPDDGRTTLYLAPYIGNTWDWARGYEFRNSGDIVANDVYLRSVSKWASQVIAGAGDNLGNHTATQNINMSGAQITNLGAPVNTTDVTTKKYVDDKVKSLVYTKEQRWTPNSGTNLGQNVDVLCDAGDQVLSCTWMPGPLGNPALRIHDYFLITLSFPTNYAFNAYEIVGGTGCKFSVTQYPQYMGSWAYFDITTKCLNIN